MSIEEDVFNKLEKEAVEKKGRFETGNKIRREKDFVLEVNPDYKKIMSNNKDTEYEILEISEEYEDDDGIRQSLTIKNCENGDVYKDIDDYFFQKKEDD